MGRAIVTTSKTASGVAGLVTQPPGQPPPDGYLTKLVKYVPAEVVSMVVAANAAIGAAGAGTTNAATAYWIVFGVGLLGTPLYLWKVAKVTSLVQLAVSTVAFVIWIFAIGGPFETLNWYENNKVYAAIALPLFTFLAATIDP